MALLKSGYPLLESMHIVGVDITELKAKLEQGDDIKELLLRNQQGAFYTHLHFFLQVTSLPQAIEAALEMEGFEKGFVKKLSNVCAYPLFIMLFAYVMTIFFANVILPQMLESFTLGEEEGILLILVRILSHTCSISLLLLPVLSVLCVILYLRPVFRLQLWQRLQHHIGFLRDHTSYLFAGYLLQLEKQGISTQKAIRFLCGVKQYSLLCVCAKHCEMRLLDGEDFITILQTEPGLNTLLRRLLPLGIMSASLCEVLAVFMEQQQVQWERKLKKIALWIQFIAYGFVGILVLIVYQLILVPLSMLEQF